MEGYMRASIGDRRSLELHRRRSQDLQRSQRRYDEHWGAAESTDTRLKCRDGVQLCVHSQMISCWSPIMRDMIQLYPSHGLVESMHGPTYVFAVDDDSASWTAVLNYIYPVQPHQELSWELTEAAVNLADKYGMSGVVQNLLCSVGRRPLSLESAQPNFVLRWLALAQRMQCHELGAALLGWLRPVLPALAHRPHSMAAFMAYASQHLDKELLLLLLEAAVESAGSSSMGSCGRASTTSRASFDDGVCGRGGHNSVGMMHMTASLNRTDSGSDDTDSDGDCCSPGRPCALPGCPSCARVASAYTSSLYGPSGGLSNNALYPPMQHRQQRCISRTSSDHHHPSLLLQLGLQH